MIGHPPQGLQGVLHQSRNILLYLALALPPLISMYVYVIGSLGSIPAPFWLAPIGGILALVMARFFSASVMRKSEGDPEMVRIAQAVREGAIAYLKRQYRIVVYVFVGLVVFLGILAAMGLQPTLSLVGVPLAGFLSGLCGWFGMKMATNASARTAEAVKTSLNEGLKVAFRSGAVMGLNVVGFAILDVAFWFILLTSIGDKLGINGGIVEMSTIMLSFGMGASTQALFARVGGGIYTKAADVGADLVGKIEAGIPEDDARNPATIADNVGDNVGDVAGMGADLYESYYGSILATFALGAASAFALASPEHATAFALKLGSAPIALAGMGIFASILGIFTVRARKDASFSELLKGLHFGVYVASGLIVLGAFGMLYVLLGDDPTLAALGVPWWRFGLSIVAGLVAGLVIAHATEYYTSYEHPPTKRIAEQALTGPATVIISGIAEGMKSTWASLLTVVIAILAAFSAAGGSESFLLGLFGVGIAAVGMLSTLGITLATDAYGPIADNAGGNAEMTDQDPEVRKRTDMLDSLGNTTAATGKGFAIGSAALTAMALLAAYVQIVQTQLHGQAARFAEAELVSVETPTAVYKGYGIYGLAFPDGTFDGAIAIKPQGMKPLSIATEAPSKGDVMPWVESPFRLRTSELGIKDVLAYYDVSLTNPRVLGGLFVGAMLAFVFCALTMNAVGRAAYEMMGECRRQFGKMREAFRANGMSEEDIANPLSWPKQVKYEGVEYPDYATCVSISTAGAQREMVFPAILAIVSPLILGLILGVAGVMGMLVGGLVSGFALAVFMANAGGAWDNAKKLLESYGKITAKDFKENASVRESIPESVRSTILDRAKEAVRKGDPELIVYGKGSDDHKATVVGDTVGDPFKDTSGPSLNILIKLISIVSVVFAGLVVNYGAIVGSFLGLE